MSFGGCDEEDWVGSVCQRWVGSVCQLRHFGVLGVEESNAEESNWQIRERESKEAIILYLKLPHLPFLGLC